MYDTFLGVIDMNAVCTVPVPFPCLCFSPVLSRRETTSPPVCYVVDACMHASLGASRCGQGARLGGGPRWKGDDLKRGGIAWISVSWHVRLVIEHAKQETDRRQGVEPRLVTQGIMICHDKGGRGRSEKEEEG